MDQLDSWGENYQKSRDDTATLKEENWAYKHLYYTILLYIILLFILYFTVSVRVWLHLHHRRRIELEYKAKGRRVGLGARILATLAGLPRDDADSDRIGNIPNDSVS